jgi:hypothetical protein
MTTEVPISMLNDGEVQSDADAQGAMAVNYDNGTVVEWTLDANVTEITFQNLPKAGRHAKLSFYLRQGTGGSKTVTWPGTVDWGNAGAPVLSTAAGRTDVVVIVTIDGGLTWAGFLLGKGFSGI